MTLQALITLGGLKRVKPPEAFGERSRDWSLGHAGDEGPHLAMPGESGVILERLLYLKLNDHNVQTIKQKLC